MKPNILFILADQFRSDALGVVNGWVRTPNLDRLCSRGFSFSNAFCNSVECIPSRISLATGHYPHQSGVLKNVRCTLNPNFPNWMRSIANQGYSTSIFGKTHLHPHEGDLRDRLPLMHAYGLQVVDETPGPRASTHVLSNMTQLWQDCGLWEAYKRDFADRFATRAHLARPSSLPVELYYDTYVARAACQYLQTLPQDAPWFCWVSFGGPHEPWDAPEPYASMYPVADVPAPIPRINKTHIGGLLEKAFASRRRSPADLTIDEVAHMKANYAGNVTLIDDQIGAILKLVENRGETNNTLVVFTSDHGEMNGDHGLIYKSNFLDQAVKVPLIVAPPASITYRKNCRGVTIKMIVELMDVGATIVDYAAGELPTRSRAKSLRSLMEQEAADHRDFAISEFSGYSMIATERWKAEFDRHLRPTLLVDRENDPAEQIDLSAEASSAPVLVELKDVLRAFRGSTTQRGDVVNFYGAATH